MRSFRRHGSSANSGSDMPCPPASVPWATMTSAPASIASRACDTVAEEPRASIAYGFGERPWIAERKHDRGGPMSESALQDLGPLSETPSDEAAADPGVARALPFLIKPAAVGPYPPPSNPSPPAWLTAAASLPPETRSIGASRTGYSIPSVCVKRF